MTENKSVESSGSEGQRIMQEVFRFIGRFVCYPMKHAQVAHALWIVHTHLMENWEHTPRIAFLSPEPGSGKSRALEVTEALVPGPVCVVNVSTAYFFRKVASQDGATVLFDEIDTIFGPKAREHEELRGFLNAGYQRGAVVGRCAIVGNQVKTEELPAYAAVALAGLGWLPDTILTRSIIVRMRRRHMDETVNQFRRRIHIPEGHRVRALVESWAKTAVIELPGLPEQIRDRDADVWEPLISVADAIGGDWPALAREAAVAIVEASKEREPSLGTHLLSDLRNIFGDAEELSTKAILKALNGLEEAPWGDLRGKPLDDRNLARLLKDYGVKSRTVRIGDTTPKGYRRVDLDDAWRRYLPDHAKSATSATSATDHDDSEAVADVADVADFFEGDGGADEYQALEQASRFEHDPEEAA